MIILVFLVISSVVEASIIGVSTHPLSDEARVLSAEMTGYMSQRQEMGTGIRYTQEAGPNKLIDFSVAGAQDSRGLIAGGGIDFEFLNEDINRPRISLKPFIQYQKFESSSSNILGAAPSIRKSLTVSGHEIFPYLAIPSGMKINSVTSEFVYYAALTVGLSMPFPGAHHDRILLSIEGNRNLGASSDYIGCLVSWIWK